MTEELIKKNQQQIIENYDIVKGIHPQDVTYHAHFIFILLNQGFKIPEIKSYILNKFEKLPEIYADVVSAADNPNCSCRGRVIKYIQQHIDECLEIYKDVATTTFSADSSIFYAQLLDEQTQLIKKLSSAQPNKESNKKVMIEETLRSSLPKFMEGLVATIPNDDIAYGSFIKSLRESGDFYHGFNIIPVGDKLKIYFY